MNEEDVCLDATGWFALTTWGTAEPLLCWIITEDGYCQGMAYGHHDMCDNPSDWPTFAGYWHKTQGWLAKRKIIRMGRIREEREHERILREERKLASLLGEK